MKHRFLFSKKIVIFTLLIIIAITVTVLGGSNLVNNFKQGNFEHPLAENSVGNYSVYSKEIICDTLAEAVEAASNDDTITLLQDTTDISDVTVTKKVILDLNNHKITRGTKNENNDSIFLDSSKTILVAYGGKLTVIGESEGEIFAGGSDHFQCKDAITVKDGGTFTLNSGRLVAPEHNALLCESENTEIKAYANIEDGNLLGLCSVKAGSNSIVNINGGILNGVPTNMEGSVNSGVSIDGGIVNVGNSTVSLNYESLIIYNGIQGPFDNGGSWNFYNGIISGYTTLTVPQEYKIYDTNPNQVREDCEVKILNNEIAYLVDKTENAVTLGLTHTDGNVIAGNTINAASILGSNYGTIQISSSDEDIATAKIEDDTLKITGINAGNATITLTSSNDTSKTAQFEITVNNAIYSIESGDSSVVYYSKLSDAYDNAKDNDVIKLLKDTTDTSDVSTTKKITLNTNGKTIERQNSKIIISAEGILTIQGNGTINQGAGYIKVTDGGILNIINGIINTTGNTGIHQENYIGGFVSPIAIICDNSSENTQAIVNIKEGTVSQIIENKGKNAILNVTGGKIPQVYNSEGGIVNIGSKTSEFNKTNPELNIIRNTDGAKWNFYNGILKAEANTYDIEPNEVREGYKITTVDGTENTKETYLVENSQQPEKTKITIPTPVEGLVYNGEEQTGVAEGEGYTITGNKATETGEYTAIVSLRDKENTQWSDNTTEDKNIKWNIAAKDINVKEEYEIEKNVIKNIQPNTKFEQFKTKIESSTEYQVIQGENIITESDLMKTGQILKIGEKEYTIIVNGDTNGDGKADIRDILQINKHRLNKIKLEGAFLTAGDVNKDNKVDIRDILQINKFRLKKIDKI